MVVPTMTITPSSATVGTLGAFIQSVPSLFVHLSTVYDASVGVSADTVSANAAVPGITRLRTIKRARSRLSDLFFIVILQVSLVYRLSQPPYS